MKQIIPRIPEGHYLQRVKTCIAGYGNKAIRASFEYAGLFAGSALIGNLAVSSRFLLDID